MFTIHTCRTCHHHRPHILWMTIPIISFDRFGNVEEQKWFMQGKDLLLLFNFLCRLNQFSGLIEFQKKTVAVWHKEWMNTTNQPQFQSRWW